MINGQVGDLWYYIMQVAVLGEKEQRNFSRWENVLRKMCIMIDPGIVQFLILHRVFSPCSFTVYSHGNFVVNISF